VRSEELLDHVFVTADCDKSHNYVVLIKYCYQLTSLLQPQET
jgi:hypothetical protein